MPKLLAPGQSAAMTMAYEGEKWRKSQKTPPAIFDGQPHFFLDSPVHRA
jgi:hypothetical protein